MMFLLLLINSMHIVGQLCSQLCCSCPVLCSNCGHEDVQWVSETYVHHNNHSYVDELVFLLIKYLKGTI